MDHDHTLSLRDWRGVEATLFRMRELGFEFEHGRRRDGLDWLIRPMPTDPGVAAEVGWLFAAFTGPDVDSYLLQIEHLLFGEAFDTPDFRPPAGLTWGYLLPNEARPPTEPRAAWRPGDTVPSAPDGPSAADDGTIDF